MKKRITLLVLPILTIAMILVGCGSKVNATDKAISVGRSAIEIADEYLDNNCTADSALRDLEALSEKMEYVDSMPNGTSEEQSQRTADFGVQSALVVLSHEIMMDKYQNDRYDDIVDARNEIAELIGEDKR